MSQKQDEQDLKDLAQIIKRNTQLLAKATDPQEIAKYEQALTFAQNWFSRLSKKLKKKGNP